MEGLLGPNEIAKRTKINKSTLNNYLSDIEFFPPAKIDDDNGYRYYNQRIIKELILFKALKKRPFRLKIYEIKNVFKKCDRQKMVELYEQSNDALYKYLKENKFF